MQPDDRTPPQPDPWQDLKRRFLASLNGANLILVLLLLFLIVLPGIVWVVSVLGGR